MSEEKRYQIAVSLIPGVGDVIGKKLIAYCGSAEAVFDEGVKALNKIPSTFALSFAYEHRNMNSSLI